MKITVARLLAPLTLLEWGAVLTYFYTSNRLSAFLHPEFRPLVLATGVLLLGSAVCVLLGTGEETGENHNCYEAGCDYSHRKLTTGAFLAFLILFVPIVLAAKLSPDQYGAVLIENRGVAESLPLALSGRVPSRSEEEQSTPAAAQPDGEAKARYVGVGAASDSPVDPANLPDNWVPPNAPDFSQSTVKEVQEDEYPSADAVTAKLRADSNTSIVAAQKLPKAALMKEPMRALNERPGAETPLGKLADVLGMADSKLKQGSPDSLETTAESATAEPAAQVDVVDLLVASQQPELIQRMNGRRVTFVGQVLPAEGGNFRMLRLLVLCCAADAQPLAVRVETNAKSSLAEMTWATVIGRVRFIKRGGETIPIVTADKVTAAKQPNEPYLY